MSARSLGFHQVGGGVHHLDAEDDNGHILKLNLYSDRSGISDMDDETERLHLRQNTSLNTKLQRIRDGTTPELRKRKKKVKNNKSCKDWWIWYWSNPVDNLSFAHFFVMFLLCPILSIFWLMDNDSCFIIAGSIGLFMSIYAFRKFRILIGLKREINKYKELNLKFKKDNIKLQKEVDRVLLAHKELKKTKKRITRANQRHRDNLRAFESIQVDMKLAGTKQVNGMTNVHHKAVTMKQSWRDELLSKERELLHSAFERFENAGDRTDGVTHDEFRRFSKLLPKRYSKRYM